MKIPATAFLYCLVVHPYQASAGSTLQRKRSSRGNSDVRKSVSDTKFSGEDQLLWERILQDAGMSMSPTDPPTKAPSHVPTTTSSGETPQPAPFPTVPAVVTTKPTVAPVPDPTMLPTSAPVPGATPVPSTTPTVLNPTAKPTFSPAPDPTLRPNSAPVLIPTPTPIKKPTTKAPTPAQFPDPTALPTLAPVPIRTPQPTSAPGLTPSPSTSKKPTTKAPTPATFPDPTAPPTLAPVPVPTPRPTSVQVVTPTPSTSKKPTTKAPTPAPVPDPTSLLTSVPVWDPTLRPTSAPVLHPPQPQTKVPTTKAPTTAAPVPDPTAVPPMALPTFASAPVLHPTTKAPTTAAPVPDPTAVPPMALPTFAPGVVPTAPPNPAPVVSSTPPPVPSSNVRTIVAPVALQGGAEWADSESYTAKAITWLETDPFSQTVSDARIKQRYALACIYYATYAVQTIYTIVEPRGWIDATGWIGNGDECSWFGLTCNSNSEVEQIVLASNRLTGSFPGETAIMASSINRIDLFRNSVYNTGDEGNAWLGQLTNLKELFYGQTNFEYSGIPPQIGKLTNLVEYDCSFTLYFGPLVGSIFAPMKSLEYLVLSGNAYNTSIPAQIGQLPKLQFLYVQNAFVDGDLSFMQHMTSIVECWVDQNPGLGGTIPTFVGNIQSLQSWSITRCGFNGPIPSEVGNLNNMVRMWLYDNMLTGTVPVQVGNMFKLQTLELEENLLTGIMPQDICINRVPLGLLATLEADCGGTPAEIECDCCTCCENCLPALARTQINGVHEN